MAKAPLFLIPIVAACLAAQPAAQQPSAPPAASSPAGSSLDFEVFKTRVQPILTSPRKGNARCTACHSRAGGNSFLETPAPGTMTFTEEQSRRNFERVQRLVLPGVPLKSLLLVNPLAEDAGGSHWHGGGKHWRSQNDPEWQTLATWVRSTSGTVFPPSSASTPSGSEAGAPASSAATSSRLNYEVFKSRVQPILTSPRKGNARCTACHSRAGGNTFLETPAPGTLTFTEEQSRRNFERVQRLVLPGVPLKSLLLINPLAEEAGGSHWHGGGKHWHSQTDTEWQILAAWVRGS